MAPFVTFIIPSYGRESLNDTLASLQEQSDSDWEALIVCDPRWVPGIGQSKEDKRVYYVRGWDRSAGLLRNIGIKEANGEWVAFVDDDDTVSPQYVEHLREHSEDYPQVDVVIFRMLHPTYGVLPPQNMPVLQQGLVGISYALKREIQPRFIKENVVSSTDTRLNTHEDIQLLQELRNQNYEMYFSPHVDYKVGR